MKCSDAPHTGLRLSVEELCNPRSDFQKRSISLYSLHQKRPKISFFIVKKSHKILDFTEHHNNAPPLPPGILLGQYVIVVTHKANMKSKNLDLKSDSHLPKKIIFICFDESPLGTMKNAFYFILKALLR